MVVGNGINGMEWMGLGGRFARMSVRAFVFAYALSFLGWDNELCLASFGSGSGRGYIYF